ncbi:unnamed protein product [Nezara viridula]|uniref:Uncharacterized protein n=1 Tax=Nezara viridula TaxID=85310 RepID=A0A9P0HFY5_NEZVI|nr:unnamed protein product [Nezara viridula]
MRKHSALPSEIRNLNKDIVDFQNNYKTLTDVHCGSDCYCRKKGNHKVTNSLYHKQCITMKKHTLNATVQKTDIVHPRRKCNERINVFNMNKARVEVSVKRPLKERIIDDKVKTDGSKQVVKFIDKGTDPITIVEPKVSTKQSWSDILSDRSRTKAPQSSTCTHHLGIQDNNRYSPKSTECHKYHASSRTSSPVSSYKNPSKVIFRDKGTQSLDEITKGDLIPVCLPRLPTDSISNPLISLQALIKELKDFKRRVLNQKDYNVICCIISEMEIALNVLNKQSKPSSAYHKSNKNSEYQSMESNVNSAKSQKNEKWYKSLEDTCTQLKSACQLLEETCEKLRFEKDHVTEKFFEKSREVENCLKRELEYQAKLSQVSQEASSMTLQIDQYSKSVEELTFHVRKLQEENRELEKAEEEKVQLHAQLMDASRENDKLNAELQLLTLEQEKNKVLLDIKEKEMDKLRKQIVSIGGLVSAKMNDHAMRGDNFQYSALSSTIGLLDLNLSDTKNQEIAFSSPDGSMTSPSKSWKAMSSIAPTNTRGEIIANALTDPLIQKGENAKIIQKGETPPLESIKHLKNELRELFAQMKKQTEVSEALLLPELKANSEVTAWSSITDSSDGYISITDADCSSQDT